MKKGNICKRMKKLQKEGKHPLLPDDLKNLESRIRQYSGKKFNFLVKCDEKGNMKKDQPICQIIN